VRRHPVQSDRLAVLFGGHRKRATVDERAPSGHALFAADSAARETRHANRAMHAPRTCACVRSCVLWNARAGVLHVLKQDPAGKGTSAPRRGFAPGLGQGHGWLGAAATQVRLRLLLQQPLRRQPADSTTDWRRRREAHIYVHACVSAADGKCKRAACTKNTRSEQEPATTKGENKCQTTHNQQRKTRTEQKLKKTQLSNTMP